MIAFINESPSFQKRLKLYKTFEQTLRSNYWLENSNNFYFFTFGVAKFAIRLGLYPLGVGGARTSNIGESFSLVFFLPLPIGFNRTNNGSDGVSFSFLSILPIDD